MADRKRARTSLSTGLEDGAAGVDRENRVIRGASVITRGEAAGHGAWIDGEMLDQVVAAGNAAFNGVKARFTHPGLCSDGLGKYLGRHRNFRRDGDQVRADLHLAKVASESPDGDLAGYVMGLAEEDPDAFGESIVFFRDEEEEQEFGIAYTDDAGAFVSPDPDNEANLPHWRLAELETADVVDEPAANAGMFSRLEQGALAAQADAFMDWALGRDGAEPPDDVALGLGMESERAREWLNGYLARRGLKIVSEEPGNGPAQTQVPPDEETEMADETKEAAEVQAAALREEGQKEEQARLARLNERWPDRPEFVLEQFQAGHDVDEAESAFKDVQLAEKDAEIEALKAGAAETPQKKAGAAPVEHSEQASEGDAQTFEQKVAQYQAEHAGCSRGDAMIECSKLYPKLADAACMPAGVAERN